MESKSKPVIVVTGQTASGKSDIALKLARKYNGEIIAADSRTVYKGMDIGTAKPSEIDQAKIQYHGLDLINPDEAFSAAEFQRYAIKTVNEIHDRGKLPIIVGGTGLYVDGFVYSFEFPDKPDPKSRAKFETLNLNELQKLGQKAGIDPDQTNYQNNRHLRRALEREGQLGNRKQKPTNLRIFGLKIDKEELDQRIAKRVDTMLRVGLIQEVQNLINLYEKGVPGLFAPGYKEVMEYINGSLTIEETKQKIIRNHKNLAKRQQTWFKRNKDIIWCDNEQQVDQNVRAFLSKFATIDS